MINDSIIRLEKLLKCFDVPSFRRTLNKNNLTWLNKHLDLKNKNHPSYTEASTLINDCLTNHYYKS